MTREPARERFTADPYIVERAIDAAAKDPRYDIAVIGHGVYEWVHYYDERGRGTKPNNERTDFTRWLGGVLTTRVKTERPERRPTHQVILESDAPIRVIT